MGLLKFLSATFGFPLCNCGKQTNRKQGGDMVIELRSCLLRRERYKINAAPEPAV